MKQFFMRDRIRAIAAVTAAVVMLCFSGAGVIAQEREESNDSSQYIPVTPAMYQVNPLYEGLITLSDIDYGPELQVTKQQVLNAENKVGSVDEAANVIKAGLKSKSKTMSIPFEFQGAYNGTQLVNIADSAFNKALVHTGRGDEGDYLKWGYSGRGMQVGYSQSNGKTIGTFSYTMTYYTTAAQEQSVTARVNQIAAGLGLASKGEYDKIVSVYQYVCNNVQYNYGSSTMKYSCYAAAVENSAVCQGYALLVYRLLNDYGVGCRMLAGNTSNGQHGWNIVRVNGLYYNIDSTWDAGKSADQYTYFMKSDADFVNHTRWAQYSGADFYSEFPMSPNSFDTGDIGSAGLIKSVSLDNDKLTLKIGTSSELSVSVNPSKAASKCTWKSSDKSVATVSSSGKVKGVAPGTCEVTVTAPDGKHKDTCYVTVTEKDVAIKSLKLNKKKLKLAKGKKYELEVKVKPDGASTGSLVWKSSNNKIAKVTKKGVVKAKGKGKCTITVTTKDGKKKATCKVTVK